MMAGGPYAFSHRHHTPDASLAPHTTKYLEFYIDSPVSRMVATWPVCTVTSLTKYVSLDPA